jgi:hypothetical protein
MQITDLALSPAMTNPAAAGTYGWRVLVTPYVPGTATGDAANTFEARTHVLFPFLLTLRAVYQSQTQRLVVSGRALALGKPLAGVSVGLFADWLTTPADEFSGVELKDATTRSDGTFSVSEPRKRMMEPNQSGKLEISAFADGVTGPCTDPSVAPGGCTSDTLSPPVTPFPGVKVSIPALAKRHPRTTPPRPTSRPRRLLPEVLD